MYTDICIVMFVHVYYGVMRQLSERKTNDSCTGYGIPLAWRMVAEQKVLPAQKFTDTGSLIQNDVAIAFNNNFTPGQHVRLLVNCGKLKKDAVGIVKFVSSQGISVLMESDSLAVIKAKQLVTLDTDEKKIYTDNQKKKKADEDAAKKTAEKEAAAAENLVVIPSGSVFVLASQLQTESATRAWVEHSLWKICVACATGQHELRLVPASGESPRRMIAAVKCKDHTLCLMPYGKVVTTGPQGVHDVISVKFELPGGNRTTSKMYVEKFESDGGDLLSDPKVFPGMSPFWFVQDIERTDEAYKLSRVIHSFDVSSAAQCVLPKSVEAGGCRVVKKAATTLKITIDIPILTNEVDVPKGAELWSE